MEKRKIICSNEDGMEVTFSDSFSPFLLENCDGIYVVENNVVTSENTMTDGATISGVYNEDEEYSSYAS